MNRVSHNSHRFRSPTVKMPHEERLVFVDLEIAKVRQRRRILQVAAIAVNQSLRELDTFEAKIRIDERLIRASQIRNRHFDSQLWKTEGRSEKAVAYDFGRFLTRHATADVTGSGFRPLVVAQLVAHNAEFDGAFLRKWFERLGLFLPASYRVFCTLHRAMWLFHEDRLLTPPDDFKLGTLCQYFSIRFPASESHDALVDVRATVELYRRMTMLAAARAAEQASLQPICNRVKGCG